MALLTSDQQASINAGSAAAAAKANATLPTPAGIGTSMPNPGYVAPDTTKAGTAGYDAYGNNLDPGAPINRPVLTPPNATSPGGYGPPTAPRTADDIYSDYVKQGQDVMDKINAVYDSAVQSAKQSIDQGAASSQQNENALASASGLIGSTAAAAGNGKIASDAAQKKVTAENDLRGKQATDVASYLQTLQSAAQSQANFETTENRLDAAQAPTLDAYYKTQAGTAFQGLAASGVDWDKFSTNPQYAPAYKSVVSAFGGDPAMAKLAFIAASKGSTNSTYLNQDPIQTADGSWVFLKQVTNPDGSTTIVPDKVDIGTSLASGENLTTLNGKPYAITKAADGTLTYKPIDTTAPATPAGFTLGSNQARYEINPDTGKYELIASKGAAPVADGSGNTSPSGTLSAGGKAWLDAIVNGNATMTNVPAALRTEVAEGLANTDETSYSPLAASRFATASNRITSNFIQLPQFQLTANGLPYLQRIDAAIKNPGSVSDQDLLDSLTKLNTAGNAISDAQVKLITDGRSLSDTVSVAVNHLENGGVLSNNQRQQIQSIAKAVYDNYKKGYQPVYDQVTKQLNDAGIPPAFWTIPNLNNLSGQIQGGGINSSGNSGGSGSDIESQAAAAGYDYAAMKADGYTDDQISQAVGQ